MADRLPNITDDLDAHAQLSAVEADLTAARAALVRAIERLEPYLTGRPTHALARCATEVGDLRASVATERRLRARRIEEATRREPSCQR